MWAYITSIAATAIAILELAKDWKEQETNSRRVAMLSLIVLAGIGSVFGTYFSDKAADKQQEEDQARVIKSQALVDAHSAKLDTIVLFLQAQLSRQPRRVLILFGCYGDPAPQAG
jgi:uncharacterized membrane protein